MITDVVKGYGGGDGSFLFDSNTSFFKLSSAPVTGYPASLFCWFKSNTVFTTALVSVGNDAGSSRLSISMVDTGDDVQTSAVDSGGNVSSAIGGDWNAGQWHSILGVQTSATDRECFLDGVSVGTNATNRLVTGLNSLTIGARYNGGALGLFYGGRIAHVTVWDKALSAADAVALHTGVRPNTIENANLKFWARLTYGVAVDEVTAAVLANTNCVSDPDTCPAGL